MAMIVFTGLHWASMPPSRLEVIDSTRLHQSGEFIEENLGTVVDARGRVTVRVFADMLQIAAYYTSRARPAQALVLAGLPSIVRWGAPMRNLHTAASPWFIAEPASYLRGQIYAFASGARTNDIKGEMRAMARGMTSAEVNSASAYFAGVLASP